MEMRSALLIVGLLAASETIGRAQEPGNYVFTTRDAELRHEEAVGGVVPKWEFRKVRQVEGDRIVIRQKQEEGGFLIGSIMRSDVILRSQAFDHLSAELQNQPSFAALLARSNCLKGEARFEEALADADAAVRLNPSDPYGHCSRGDALIGLDKLDEADAAYREAMRLDPKNGKAACCLADVSFIRGRYDDALSRLTKAIELSPFD